MMDIYSTAIIISVAIFVIIGNWSGRSVQKLDDYYVAGRNAPTLLIVGTLVASMFSTSIFMGEAGFTYAGQFGPYMLFPGLAVIGYIYGALFFGTYLRRSKAATVADYFGKRFASFRVQRAAGLTIVVGLAGYLIAVTGGAAMLIADLTGLSWITALLVAWGSYTIFTMYAGSKGVIITDTLMFLLFTFATTAFVWVLVGDLGGVKNIISGLATLGERPDIAAWHGTVGPGTDWDNWLDFLIWIIIVDVAWGVAVAVGPWQASRHLMARDEHTVLRSAIYACIAVIFMQYLIYGSGGVINLANTDIDPIETVMIWAAQNLVPEILGALLLAGIVAAALSSASTFLSLIGFSLSNDILQRDEPLSLGWTRVIMLVAGLVAFVACIFSPPDIFELMLAIGTMFASSWGVVAFMSVWSKRITADAAFWGITCGCLFNLLPLGLETADLISLPAWADPTIIGTLASVVAVLTISARTSVSDAELEYREAMHITPDEDRCERKYRITRIAPVCLIIYGCVMPFLLANWYVHPYQSATGTLAPGGGIDWTSGEAILTLTFPLVYVTLGVLAWWLVKKRYGETSS